jgi:hypothetical protein
MMRGRLIGAVVGLCGCLSLSAQSIAPPITIVATLSNASASAVATDAAGNIYIAGATGSREFRTTPRALKRICDDPCYSDAVIAKVDRRGRLMYATYLGGSSNDEAHAIAVDALGQMYVAGTTWSADFPVTRALVAPRAAQQSFLVKLSSDGRLLYSTTLGGEGATALALDSGGDMFVAGFAYSDTVPMVNAIQPVRRGGRDSPDVFVARFKADESGLAYSTYLGGAATDTPAAVAVDLHGSMVVVGRTSSADFPVVRAAQSHYAGQTDAFVTRIASDGSFLEFSTLLGGADLDDAQAVAVGSDGVIVVTGGTQSADFAVTDDALDAGCGTDGACNPTRVTVRGFPLIRLHKDAFLAAFDHHGVRRFSSFMGGSGFDEARAIGIASDRMFISALSASPELAPGAVPCEAEFACPPLLFEIGRRGPALISQVRLPIAASYTPGFSDAPMSLGVDGSVVIVANRWPTMTITRRAPMAAIR